MNICYSAAYLGLLQRLQDLTLAQHGTKVLRLFLQYCIVVLQGEMQLGLRPSMGIQSINPGGLCQIQSCPRKDRSASPRLLLYREEHGQHADSLINMLAHLERLSEQLKPLVAVGTVHEQLRVLFF